MPSTIAYYVQATSRAGRTGVGIVFTGLSRYFARDRSVFHFFDAQHRYVNVLVEPVALNRFSTHGPRKTASGLIAAILTQQWARDPALLAAAPGFSAPADLSRADLTRRLLTRLQAAAAAGTGPDPAQAIRDAVRAAYGLGASVLDPDVARLFTAAVDRQVDSILASIEGAHEFLLTRSMRPRPPRSLRDVDASAEFGTDSYSADQRFRFLGADQLRRRRDRLLRRGRGGLTVERSRVTVEYSHLPGQVFEHEAYGVYCVTRSIGGRIT